MPTSIQKIATTASSAAFLQVWRCPVVTGAHRDDVLVGQLADWGVLLRGTAAVSETGIVHTVSCPDAAAMPPVRRADLLRIIAEPCEKCPPVEALTPTAAWPGPADHQLEELMERLEHAVAALPSGVAAGCADRRTMLLCAAFLKATARFQRTAAVPPRLDAALSRFNAWLTQSGDEARGRLRTDGLQRLHNRMRAHYGEPAPTAGDRRRARPGAARDWAVCMFSTVTPYADVAAFSAPVSATEVRELRAVNRRATRAVALLPREIAAYLLRDYAAQVLTARVPTGAMTIADWVPDATTDLQKTVETTLAIWTADTPDPAAAWHAARILTP